MTAEVEEPTGLVVPEYGAVAGQIALGILETIGDAVVAVDAGQRIIAFNNGARAMFGYDASEALGMPLEKLIPSESRAGHAGHVAAFDREDRPSRRMGERRLIEGLRRDGSRFAAGATIARVDTDAGRVFVAVVRDISEHVETREHLQTSLRLQEALARTDPLTELGNLRAFREALERELARLRRDGAPFTITYVDLDRFKVVNDTFGHEAGDELLRDTAHRLQEHFRAMDTVARIGGDEFAILSPESDADHVAPRVEELRRLLQADVRRRDARVTASVGVLTCRVAPDTAEACMAAADRLMYRVKHAERDGVAYGLLDGTADDGTPGGD